MRQTIHPLQGVLLAGVLPLFIGALLSDLAYASTYQVQWKNFASWLLVGGSSIGLVVVAWAIADCVRLSRAGGLWRWVYLFLLLAMWILALLDTLIHARDAWASMPAGLALSALVVLLAAAAVSMGFSNYHRTRVTT